MANQPTIKSSFVSGNDDSVDNIMRNFKWTIQPQKSLLFNMTRLKPSGINKYLNMFLIREKICEETKLNIPSECIWEYLNGRWNIEIADILEHTTFNTSVKDFCLPEEFKQLITEQKEKIKIQEKESLNTSMKKKKSFNSPNKIKSKPNSLSCVDLKDGFNEIISSTQSDLWVKSIENVSEEVPNPRRSLRTNDKSEEKELEADSSNKRKLLRVNNKSNNSHKLNDVKLLNKKQSNQFKDIEKNEEFTKVGGRKRKSRNISESSFSSDNSKQLRNHKNNLTDLTISDTSSRSVTPEILRSKTSHRSDTNETTGRKSNLRSGDRDQKSKLAIEKVCIKLDHHVDLILPHIKIERLKTDKCEKQFSTLMESKSKQLLTNKIESLNKVKGKTRGRVTSDLLVAQQSPDIQALGRRSCSYKSS